MPVHYERPVEAALHVHLANGETFEARPEALKKFGNLHANTAFHHFSHRWAEAMEPSRFEGEPNDQPLLQPVLNLVWELLTQPESFAGTSSEVRTNLAALTQAERDLRSVSRRRDAES